jgi:hypothetical protein
VVADKVLQIKENVQFRTVSTYSFVPPDAHTNFQVLAALTGCGGGPGRLRSIVGNPLPTRLPAGTASGGRRPVFLSGAQGLKNALEAPSRTVEGESQGADRQGEHQQDETEAKGERKVAPAGFFSNPRRCARAFSGEVDPVYRRKCGENKN